MRALVLAAGWLVTYFLIAQYGVLALPTSVAQRTTLPQYLALVQIVSILVGVSTLLAATRATPRLRALFFPEIVSITGASGPSRLGRILLWAILLAPLTYLCAHALGMYSAFDTLIAELAARGRQAVQDQTGALGRSAQADTLLTIVPFTVLLAPLGEELLFRGGIYGAVQWLFTGAAPSKSSTPKSAPSVSLDGVEPDAASLGPESLVIAGLPQKKKHAGPSAFLIWGRAGGFAALASTAIFGAMHADTPGGMGIVRWVSATVLGLALGLTRKASGGLLAPLLLHATYNLLSLATIRGWIVFESWPTKFAVPTFLGPLSGACTALVVAHYLWVKKTRGASGDERISK